MSRAFVKESDGEELLTSRPRRQHSGLPNYITPKGEAALRGRVAALTSERDALRRSPDRVGQRSAMTALEQDLAYLRERLERAIVVPPPRGSCAEVTVGARVTLVDEAGCRHVVTVVGEDETDVAAGRISWCSPLGRAVLRRQVGNRVVWQRPAGDLELEIEAIAYE